MNEPIEICVVTDETSNAQAMYVDEKLEQHDDTIYACDIEIVARNRPILLHTMNVNLDEESVWPGTLIQCRRFA